MATFSKLPTVQSNKATVDFLALVISDRPAKQTTNKTRRLCGSFVKIFAAQPPDVDGSLLASFVRPDNAQFYRPGENCILHRYRHCNSYLGV